MTFDNEYFKNLENKVAKDGDSLNAVSAEAKEETVDVTVVPTSGVKGRKFSKKTPATAPVGTITEVTIKTNNKETKMSGKNFKKRSGLMKKLGIGVAVVALAVGVWFGAKTYNANRANTTQNTAITETVSMNDHFKEQAVIDNTVDMMINHYIATNGKSEMSAKDSILAYYGANINTVGLDQLMDSGIVGNISKQEFAKANMQIIMQQKNDARTFGYIAEGKQFANKYDREQYIKYLKVSNEVGKGNYEAAKELDEKGLMSGSLSDNHAVNMLGFGIANDVTATKDLINKSAICIDNEKSTTVISQINTSIATDYENKVNLAINMNKGQIADGQKFVELQNKVMEAYNAKKATVQLKEESTARTIGGSEIKESESLDAALKQNPNAKVDHKNKTVNLNPDKVVDKTKDEKKETTYKDNSGKETTKEDLTKENVKTGETVVINGKTYKKGEDGKFYEVNQNAGKGVQVKEETVQQTAPKTESSTSTTTVTESKQETKKEEVKQETTTKSEKEALQEVKEQVQQKSNVKATEKFYDLEGNEYNSEAELMAAMEAKMK